MPAQDAAGEGREMERAVELIAAGRPVEAEEILQAILAAAPDHGPAHYQLGRLALERGAAVEASRHLALAVTRPLPRPYLAWHLLALAEEQSLRPEAAAAAWRQAATLAGEALARRPAFPPALRVAIAAAEWRGDLWAALEGYSDFLAQFPAAPAALAGAARAALALGAVGAARCLAGRAAEEAPGEAAVHELLASIEMAAGDPIAARASALRALEAGGGSVRGELLLGRALLDTMDIEGGVAAYRRALAADPAALAQVPPLALTALVEDDPVAMSARLRQALAADGDDVATLRGLAAAAELEGDRDAARGYLETLARLQPEDAQTQYHLGQLYLRLGEGELGSAAMERFARLKAAEDADWERHNSAFHRRAKAEELARAGEARGALEIYSGLAAEGLAEVTDFVAAGEALLALGDVTNAVPWFEQVLETTPFDEAALEGLVAAESTRGRQETADLYRHRLELVSGFCPGDSPLRAEPGRAGIGGGD